MLVVAMLWLYAGDLVLFVQAQGAKVAAVSHVPSLVLSLVGLSIALGYAATLLPRFEGRSRRLALAIALGLLFVDLTFIASRRVAISPRVRFFEVIQGFAQEASRASAPEGVVRDPRVLRELLPRGPIPMAIDGVPLKEWKLEVREGCSGPATDVRGATAGTVLYCVASNHQRAWVTLVATAEGQRFGDAALVGSSPEWIGQVSYEAENEVEDEGQRPVWLQQPRQAE